MVGYFVPVHKAPSKADFEALELAALKLDTHELPHLKKMAFRSLQRIVLLCAYTLSRGQYSAA